MKAELRLEDAVRVKKAELWLVVQKPVEAVLELQRLSKQAWQHEWPERVLWEAATALEHWWEPAG